jgi:hypothetical protein
MEETKQPREGHQVRQDPDAVSASPDLPAFIARPPGSPAYYGFPLLADSEKDGYVFGVITEVRGDPPPSWGMRTLWRQTGREPGSFGESRARTLRWFFLPSPGDGGLLFSL